MAIQENKIRKPNIVVVDDEEIVRDLLEEVLIMLGYTPIIFDSPIKVISEFRQKFEGIDLILMDMIMPEMSGEKLFESIREIDPDQKVIVLSGYSDNEESKRMLDEGVVGFIQKPVTIGELSKIIEQSLKK